MKDVILITTPPEVLLAQVQNLPMKDWSDVAWFFIGFVALCLLLMAFHGFFTEKKREKDAWLSETERNRRIMDSMMNDCENGMR
jgi:glucose uptake protein GlcU